jgi:hypothetical protein
MTMSALGMMRLRGGGPTFANINGRILYYMDSVLELERPHTSTAEAYADKDAELEARRAAIKAVQTLGRKRRREKYEKRRAREASP